MFGFPPDIWNWKSLESCAAIFCVDILCNYHQQIKAKENARAILIQTILRNLLTSVNKLGYFSHRKLHKSFQKKLRFAKLHFLHDSSMQHNTDRVDA